MPTREPLSVAVIALNEERNLDRCLASVAWADEIVVVDGGSADGTAGIARRRGARVSSRPFRGFVEQKNHAVSLTSHRWVLSLDADEWLDEAASAAVRDALGSPAADGYRIRRRTALSGGFLDRTWAGDWQLRLFRKDRGRFAGGRVHESVRLDAGATVGRLSGRILHLSYDSIEEYVERMNRYTGLAAETLHEGGRAVPWARLVISPPATFAKLYLLKGGFLDGMRGLVVAVGSAFSVFLKYAKLWDRRRRPDPEFEQRVRRDTGGTADAPR